MPDENKVILSGTGLTKVFGFGRQRTLAVDHVDFNFYEGEVVSIVGESGSGKTTLLEKLIAELKRRGYRLATVKHHAHPGFEIDYPGKDTWRHAQAGSDQVIIAAPDKLASIRRLERELSLDEIAGMITGVDIILTDGFKSAGKPCLEVVRAANGLELVSDAAKLVAIASDTQLALSVPQFELDDAAGMVDWMVEKFRLKNTG